MSFDEAVDYFTEHGGSTRGPAEAETEPHRPGNLRPGGPRDPRPCAWPSVRGLGDRFSARAFHERLMRMGTISVGYFRSTFLG